MGERKTSTVSRGTGGREQTSKQEVAKCATKCTDEPVKPRRNSRKGVCMTKQLKCKCGKPTFSRGLCRGCYMAAWRSGKANPSLFPAVRRGRPLKEGSNGMARHLAESRRVAIESARTTLRELIAGRVSVPCSDLRQILDILTEG